MPLGDSTTASVCYRAQLWQMLTQSGRTQFQFIGSRNGDPGCGVSGYDRDNEGHGGYIVTDMLKAAGTGVRPGGADSSDPFVSDARDLATWFDDRPADIVLMHFGTNDVWNNITPTNILNAYTAILGKLRAVNPNVRVLVAQIISAAAVGLQRLPDARAGVERTDPELGGGEQHGGVADHRGRPEHRIQPGHRHRRRRPPEHQRLHEDRGQSGSPPCHR